MYKKLTGAPSTIDFLEELKNESITLLIVNVDDEKNYKLAEKFRC